MAPADDDAWRAVLARISQWGLGFGTRGDLESAAREYRSALGDLPAWVLAAAVERTLAAWRWPNFPPPAEIRDRLPDKRHELTRVINRLRMAERWGREADDGPRATAEQLDNIRRLTPRLRVVGKGGTA